MRTTILNCDRCKKDVQSVETWGISVASPGSHVWTIDLCAGCRTELRLFTNPPNPTPEEPKPERDLVGALETLREWLGELLDEAT